MAEHRGPGHVPTIFEYWHEYDPVRQVRHCRITHVRIIRQDDVVFFDLTFIGFHEAANE